MIAKVNETFVYTAAGGGATKTVTIPAPTAGNTLVLMIENISAYAVSAVSGGGVTWTQVFGANGVAGRVEIWIGANSSGSGTTVNVTVGSAYGRYDINVTEWSGMPVTLTADGGSFNTAAADPNVVTPAVTPTAGKPVLLLAAACSYTTTYTAGPSGGFTALSTASGDGYGYFAYQIVASASGSYQCGWTSARSYGTNVAGLYAFDGSTGGGGSSPIPQSGWEGGFDSGMFHHGALNGGLNA